MATKKRKRFNEGGFTEAQDKAAGLEASKDERVGFAGLGRFFMGSIDDPNSEAYHRFGAGRAKADRARAESKPSTDVYRVDSGPGSLGMSDEDKPSTNVYRVDSGPGKLSTGATKTTPAKRPAAPTPARAASSSPYRVDSGPGNLGMNYSNEGRGRQMTKEQQYARAEAEARSPEGVARRKKMEAAQGLERVTPETAFLPVGNLKTLQTAAKSLANRGFGAAKKTSETANRGSIAAQRRAELKKQAEEGIDRNLQSEFKDLAASAAKSEREKVTNPLAWMAGPKGMADDFKRGGKVKAKVKKMASGGSTSGASKRADGIAQRGKTRGRIY